MEQSTVVHTHTPAAGGVRARVERGQRGGYAWELSIEVPRQSADEAYAAAFERAIAALTAADAQMGRVFGGPANPAVSPQKVAARRVVVAWPRRVGGVD